LRRTLVLSVLYSALAKFPFDFDDAPVRVSRTGTIKKMVRETRTKASAWQYLKVEEGIYENGAFKLLRIRNGDETDWGGPRFGPVPAVLQTTLIVR
jgi:Domain of unknown function (DUF5597)